ncbi:MAG: transglycosylase domain-containing protein [Corynebacterium sp.]|nr:transglycosylase domain-containing protein [Corynebacterium sp.]
MHVFKSLSTIIGAILTAGVIAALALTPIATVGALAVIGTDRAMNSKSTDIVSADAPGVTTILDAKGNTIATLYKQRRFQVASADIAPIMKQAIVSVEDRRFYEHEGVDWQGAFRAIARNLVSGSVEQGASTLDQQYVKNWLLLVNATNEEEQDAAIEQSIPRKLREMKMAADLDKNLSKDEIVTRYLNLVPFGNGAYGIEAAARTYFGISAKDLNTAQAAMLAGIVQSSSVLNPYTNEEGVIARRNTVLDTMADNNAISAEEAAQLKTQPLGVLPSPQGLPNGCINAGDRGFFCDYVLKYLADKGYDEDKLEQSSYVIRTTLDPDIQDAAHASATRNVSTTTDGVAEVMDVIQPGTNSRKVLAMTSSRDYGLDLDKGQTVYNQPYMLTGNGAGSVFKIFTAAVAIEHGVGVNTYIDVPRRYQAQGLGSGGASNCPAGYYCVENDGAYAARMTLQQALAQSPNTAFVELIDKLGVKNVVDMAVKLGLRSYTQAGSYDGESSIADYVSNHNLGSFTLGATPVNALELSNVGATIASGGTWCEPSPIESITGFNNSEVNLNVPDCEQVLDSGVAGALETALSQDVVNGTASSAARSAGWSGQLSAKTGTTENYGSAAFIGFNSVLSAAPVIFNDGTSTSPLCTSPVRQCSTGNLYGGYEPARTWFGMATAVPGAQNPTLPAVDSKYLQGTSVSNVPIVTGLSAEDAQRRIEAAGYQTRIAYTAGNGTARGRVVSVDTTAVRFRGDTVTIYVSDGTTRTTTSAAPTTTTPTEVHTGTDEGLVEPNGNGAQPGQPAQAPQPAQPAQAPNN